MSVEFRRRRRAAASRFFLKSRTNVWDPYWTHAATDILSMQFEGTTFWHAILQKQSREAALFYNLARGSPSMKAFLTVLLLSSLASAQTTPRQPRVVRYQVKPSQLKYTYAASYAPVARLRSGDILETNTVDCFGNAIQKPGDTLSMSKGDNPLTGPFYMEGAEPGDTLAVKILDLK